MADVATPSTHSFEGALWVAAGKAFVRRLAARLRYLPDAFLHPVRRRRAHGRMAGRRVQSVTFVCLGNVCRSPFAAAVFERAMSAVGASIRVRSAGFIGPDRPPSDAAIAAADLFGVDLRSHRSQLLTSAMVGNSDLIVVMGAAQGANVRRRCAGSPHQVLVLGDLDPAASDRRTIPDPWGCDEAVFVASYARIQRCVLELVRLVRH